MRNRFTLFGLIMIMIISVFLVFSDSKGEAKHNKDISVLEMGDGVYPETLFDGGDVEICFDFTIRDYFNTTIQFGTNTKYIISGQYKIKQTNLDYIIYGTVPIIHVLC